MRLLTLCVVALLALAAGRASAEMQHVPKIEIEAGAASAAVYYPPGTVWQGPHTGPGRPYRDGQPRPPRSYWPPRDAPGPAYRGTYGPYPGYDRYYRYDRGTPSYDYDRPSRPYAQPYAQRRWQPSPDYDGWRREPDYRWAGDARAWVPSWRYRQADRADWRQQWRW